MGRVKMLRWLWCGKRRKRKEEKAPHMELCHGEVCHKCAMKRPVTAAFPASRLS